MTLAEAIAAFEAQFANVEETAVYADDLAEVVTGGVKKEGRVSPALATSEGDAIRLWLTAAEEYKASHAGGRLVWRTRPEIESDMFYRQSFDAPQPTTLVLYRVYSRLAIRNTDHMAAVWDFARP